MLDRLVQISKIEIENAITNVMTSSQLTHNRHNIFQASQHDLPLRLRLPATPKYIIFASFKILFPSGALVFTHQQRNNSGAPPTIKTASLAASVSRSRRLCRTAPQPVGRAIAWHRPVVIAGHAPSPEAIVPW